MKKCRDCGVDKPLTDFHRMRSSKDGLHPYCKPCNAARSAAWQRANPERAASHKRGSQMRKRNGITQAQYDALLKRQKGVCAICKRADLLPRNKRFDIDHCHRGGHVRGLLCRRCNVILGYVSDDPGILRAAAAYLRRVPPVLE